MLNPKIIREDFPVLNQSIKGKSPIYFDNACTTLKPTQVTDAIIEYYHKYSACHGRSPHLFGRKTTEKYNKSRQKIQRFVNARDIKEIIFTKNTTESLNLVANSLNLGKDNVVITTDIEHNSNLLVWQVLKGKKGIVHKIANSKDDLTFNLDNFEELINKNTQLVSLGHCSNVSGVMIPAKEIIKIAHDYGALVMLDGAQSAPHQKIDVKKLDVDFFAFSLHKMLGPTGVGVLYGKEELLDNLPPFLVGGETVTDADYESFTPTDLPDKFEAGIQNYAGVIGSGLAIDYLNKVGIDNIENHLLGLNRLATNELKDLNNLKLIGPEDSSKRGNIFNFWIENLPSQDIAIILDESYNIMLRAGVMCAHPWYNINKIDSSVRASFYLYNTIEEVKIFIEVFKKMIDNLIK